MFEPSYSFEKNLKTFFSTLQTDDFGVFSTNLTKELAIAAETFNLSFDDLIKLCHMAIDCSFALDDEKQLIHETIDSFARNSLTQTAF